MSFWTAPQNTRLRTRKDQPINNQLLAIDHHRCTTEQTDTHNSFQPWMDFKWTNELSRPFIWAPTTNWLAITTCASISLPPPSSPPFKSIEIRLNGVNHLFTNHPHFY